ncbi:MAG: hypothetical protein HOV80_38045, partial [Polyangiaceae bacterium]|nr:hypothetical protein [Polyangiaceae bacterium]
MTDLTANWAAPHSIYWSWNLEGVPSNFLKYELVLAENVDDLRTRRGTAKVYDASTSPELGILEIPYSDATVQSTVTRGLEPLRSYLALLYVTDVNRCESTSMIFTKKTPPPTLSE